MWGGCYSPGRTCLASTPVATKSVHNPGWYVARFQRCDGWCSRGPAVATTVGRSAIGGRARTRQGAITAEDRGLQGKAPTLSCTSSVDAGMSERSEDPADPQDWMLDVICYSLDVESWTFPSANS
jgi:hypothetical protein